MGAPPEAPSGRVPLCSPMHALCIPVGAQHALRWLWLRLGLSFFHLGSVQA